MGLLGLLAVVTSILTILATGLGIFGFSQASQRDEVASSADALQRDLDAAHRTVGVLRSDNGRLKQDLSAANSDNAKLQSDNQAMQSEMEQLRGAQPAPPAAGGPAPGQPAEGPVRHDGTVTLANGGDAVDLNAARTNKLWEGEGWNSTDHVFLYSNELRFTGVDTLPTAEPATHAVCSGSSGYAPTSEIDPSNLSDKLCFRLSSGRYARILLTQGDSERVTLAITTWEKG